ncbi:MAG: hypothetical protein E6K03_10215 [Methanobacteriota archaeon]|nr:MAG: hypothetical protein E6K03_10215 [Euryarchaeota archaeon]
MLLPEESDLASPEKSSFAAFSTTERAVMMALHEVKARQSAVTETDHLWVQKVSFLFRRLLESIHPEEGPSSVGYIAYDLGPYSEEVEGALVALLKDKLIEMDDNKRFHLTIRGTQIAQELESSKPKASSALRSIVDVVELLTSNELILYVYATNPEWAKESKIKGILQSKGARFNLARKLYTAQKVSMERAAEVAGLPIKDFVSRL